MPFYHSTVRLIEVIKIWNKIGGLETELDRLSLKKYALDQACSRQSHSLVNLAKLKNDGVTEEQITSVKDFLANNKYHVDVLPS